MSDAAVSRVAIGPAVSDGVILRVVELTDGSARVETWTGSAWVTGPRTFWDVSMSSLASPETLAAAGIPLDS